MTSLFRLAVPAGGERILEPAPDPEASGQLLAEADRWGVWPAVAWNLGLGDSPRLRSVAARNLCLQREQERLLARLGEAGVKAHAVKGTDLTARLYPDLSWREVEDIDLLVEPQAVSPAMQVLCAAGLRPNHTWHPAGLERQFSHSRLLSPEVTFTAPSGLLVELHWDWPGGALPTGHLLDQPEHYLVYLCAHAGKHCWRLLKWTCDLHLFVERSGDSLDWARFWRLAEAEGVTRSCAISLELRRRWLGGPAPPGLHSQLGRSTRALAASAEAAWLEPGRPLPHPVWTRLRLAAWSDRPALLAAWLVPQPQDWNRAAARGWSAWRLHRERARHLWTVWAPRSLGRLSLAEWGVLAEAYFTVAGFETLRRLMPVRWLLPRRPAPGAPAPETTRERLKRLAWLVDVAANRQPWRVRCLTRSLALGRMLRRRGVPAEVRIGVRRGEELQAHAWVEWQGEVLHDPDQQTESYAVLPGELARR